MNERSPRRAVSLLPIFRSEAQYRLVGELFTNPGWEAAIGELADRIGASHATVSREVSRLETAGLVTSREQGRRRLVSAATATPVARPLRHLMAVVYGPPVVIREEFGDLDARVEIFGSWAARWEGQPGPAPRDVDVLVVGDVDPSTAWEAAARASTRLGIDVNVVVRDEVEWQHDPTGFAEQVKAAPRIVILSRDVPGEGAGDDGA